MMPRVIYAPQAEDDLIDVIEYIAKDKPAAARRWLEEIRSTCEMLATRPEVGEHRPDLGMPGCRSFSFGSYVIFFRRANDGIEVARIIHGSRDIGRL